MNKMKTILLLLSIIIFSSVNATIIYTDIPDGQPVGIDFNQDGTMEFDITNMNGIGDYITYAGANSNVYAINAANWDVAEDLLLNASIDAGGNWDGAGDCAITGWGGIPDFILNQDRYLGMRIDLGGITYYGWVRVEVIQNGVDAWGDPAYEVIYKDYAYENVANMAILSGDMPALGNIDVTTITVTGQGGATTVANGSTLQILASILPANATDQTVTWSVTNGTGTATISASGLLSGLTQGTVTVIATANDGSGVVGQLIITITGPIDVATITVSGQGGVTTVVDGSMLQMMASILPVNATDQSVTWSVTNGTGTATINASGLLSGLTQGTVTVIATANDGSGIVGQLIITITGPIGVTAITVTGQGGAVTVSSGSTLQMLAAILPVNATDQTVTWSITNGTGTATISASGLLSALTQGTVTVIATANDGSGIVGQLEITITTTQNILIQNLTILTPNGQDEITVFNGTLQMIVTIYPGNATNQSVTWEVINQTGSATINATGLLSAVSNGTVLVRVTANDASGMSAEKIITINMEDEVNGLENNNPTNLEIFPNPFTNQINISAPIKSIVTICDLSGKVLMSLTAESETMSVDMSQLASGIYIAMVELDNVIDTKKIVKR
jgi:uncharacterized protein YjdB